MTMMKILMSIALAIPAGAASAGDGRFDVAVTVDDLPILGEPARGQTLLSIANAHLAAFRAHGVSDAFGFVNGAGVDSSVEGGAVLDAWRKAGHSLGNHTYSHMNLTGVPSLEAWKADVEAGEPAVASRMRGRDWRWLRFPFLALSGERQEPALAYLRERGYRVADTSLSFDDWRYTEAFVRCTARNDQAAIGAMKREYFDAVERKLGWIKAASRRVYGRVIPQVFLAHMTSWSAETLPEVLRRLQHAGARYVTLAQVHADPAYAKPGGGLIIDRKAYELGIALNDLDKQNIDEPIDLEKICR